MKGICRFLFSKIVSMDALGKTP